MKFGPVQTLEAEGSVLAHSLKSGGLVLKKGHVLSAKDIKDLAPEFETLTVATLDQNDTPENEAAHALATALRGSNLKISTAFTGRANLIALKAGVVRINTDLLALNSVDEAISLATLPDHAQVTQGQLVATIKIIPYAVPKDLLDKAIDRAGPIDLHPFKVRSASLILTETPSLKRSLTQKAETVLKARLSALQIDDVDVKICDHTTSDVRDAIHQAKGEIILILGGSATSDRRDICPEGLVSAGGHLKRFGMPVDPGNLLFLGDFNGKPVVGLPGCVRSPALNGADWVLERLAAGLDVRSQDIAAMGLGGLLKEIPTRPQPRRPK